MAAIKALAHKSISKPVRVSESSETTYNLEISDESSCNSDVDILDLLISETTREPENSFCDKNSSRTSDCKVDGLTIPPTLYNLSLDVCNYDGSTDLKPQVVEMPPTVNFDICNENCLNTLSGIENSIVTDSAIDDLLSTLTIDEQKTRIKSCEDVIDLNLVDFLEKTEVKCPSIDDSPNKVNIINPQQKSCDQVSSLSLASLAECHFQENHLDSIYVSKVIPDNKVMKDCSKLFDGTENEIKEPIPHKEDFGISLSALAESYLKGETESNCTSTCALSVNTDSEQIDDLDILSFINSVDGTDEDSMKLTNCSKEHLSSNVNPIENSVFSELLETRRRSDEGYDCGNFSPETDRNCFSSQQTVSRKSSKENEDLDFLSFINSVSIIEDNGAQLANCSKETLNLNVKENEKCAFVELLATEETPDEGYDSGKMSPGIDLNNCIKRPITPASFFKTSHPNDNCSVLQPQDDCGNLELAFVSTAKFQNQNVPHAIPKPSVVNTKQSLFAKVLSCKYKEQNEKTLEKVSDLKKKLFERYFCITEQDISCEVPKGKKKFLDKSTESIITSGYLHFSALPSV